MSWVGTTLGRIRILEALGQGGMGSVYVGFDETLQRRVAVKAIRHDRSLDPETKARFLREARLLSQLDHPSICRIHEIIERPSGDVLVLELIEGESLKEAMRSELEYPFKLYVAEKVAEALVAAHGQGIAHRDLKPENVMLADDGSVKVLDFGLAYRPNEARPTPPKTKGDMGLGDDNGQDAETAAAAAHPVPAASQDQSYAPTVLLDPHGRSVHPHPTPAVSPIVGPVVTEAGTVMGTVAYMSPEQALGDPVTVAGDIYSLGLVLQELFTGRPVYDPDLALPTLLLQASQGQTRPVEGVSPHLQDLIEGMKHHAAEARPTAHEVLERIRWLRTRPQRRLLKAVATVLVLLFSAGLLKYTLDLRHQKAQAEEARREAEQVSEFLLGLFEVSDPQRAVGQTLSARELLDQGARRIRSQLEDQPLSQARMMLTMGRVYRQLGLYAEALPLLEDALRINRQHLGADHLELAANHESLANLYHDLGEYGQAEPLFLRALEIRRDHLGNDHPYVAASLNNLAIFYRAQGNDVRAEPLLRQALEIYRNRFGKRHQDVARSLNNLGDLYRTLGDLQRARTHLQEAISIQEAILPQDHPNLYESRNNLAILFHEEGQTRLAEPLYRQTLETAERVLGPQHPTVATLLNNLAELLRGRGDFDAAKPLYQRALAIQETTLGPQHPSLAVTWSHLGLWHQTRGELTEADALYRRAASLLEQVYGESHPELASTWIQQGRLWFQQGQWEAAERVLYRAVEVYRRRADEQPVPAHRGQLMNATLVLADLATDEGRLEDAARLFDQAAEVLSVDADDALDHRRHRIRLADIELGRGKLWRLRGDEARAKDAWSRALDIIEPIAMRSELVMDRHRIVLAQLYLGEAEAARSEVEHLRTLSWRHPDFVEACREAGL